MVSSFRSSSPAAVRRSIWSSFAINLCFNEHGKFRMLAFHCALRPHFLVCLGFLVVSRHPTIIVLLLGPATLFQSYDPSTSSQGGSLRNYSATPPPGLTMAVTSTAPSSYLRPLPRFLWLRLPCRPRPHLPRSPIFQDFAREHGKLICSRPDNIKGFF